MPSRDHAEYTRTHTTVNGYTIWGSDCFWVEEHLEYGGYFICF